MKKMKTVITEKMKTIVIVEDDTSIRSGTVSALKLRGFDARGAANVSQARELIKVLRNQIDVMVLDMRLQDHDYPNITGADIGLEVRRLIPKWSPEFLILSGYKQSDYYEAALTLDAAAYLEKGKVQPDEVFRHIRSLCLRRALSFEHEEIDKKIGEIAEASLERAEAVANFCSKLLAPEMQACIGLPAIFLLTDENGTQNCGNTADLPTGYDDTYAKIQALAQGAINNSEPFVFDKNQIDAPSDTQSYTIFDKLHDAAFLPIFVMHGLRLSIGILRPDESQPLPENPVELARILSVYLRPAIIEHLLRILSMLTESKIKNEAKIKDEKKRSEAERETLLKHTSGFCLWAAQEQFAILEEAGESGELDWDKEYFQKLNALSIDLRTTGEFLSDLAIQTKDEKQDTANEVAKVIQEAWHEASEQFNSEGVLFEGVSDDFSLPVARDDLFLASLRVFQWMVQRKDRTSSGTQQISVQYRKSLSQVEIIFTDRSHRLGKKLREKLFDPFTQANPAPYLPKGEDQKGNDDSKYTGRLLPLFLARMLVQVKYKGLFQDKTEELESSYGHRFVMNFPI